MKQSLRKILDGRRRSLLSAVAAAVACASILVPAPAHSGSWQADLSATYESGTYGSSETTTMVSIPLTIKRYFSRWETSITLPYLSVETKGDVVIVDGSPQSAAEGSDGSGSASGLGDIVIKGKFYAATERGSLPYIDLVARVKVPTAGTDLGTGEADFGFGAEISHSLGKKYFAMADTMYTITGDPSGTDYRNRVAWGLGGGWQPKPGSTLSISYDYKSALRSTETAARSLTVYGSRRLRPAVRLYGLLDFGLSDSASDVGLTAGVKYDF
jgi:opacity protein-like surface antigen